MVDMRQLVRDSILAADASDLSKRVDKAKPKILTPDQVKPGMAQTMPRWTVILFVYLIVLVMNFFIGSGSAKAFMLIPLIVPLSQQFGIPAQLCIVAFAFGDGFSNVLYPTNAALLISLGLADVSYGEWFK